MGRRASLYPERLGLPKAERGPGWVDNNAEPAGSDDLGYVFDHRGAERSGLFRGSRDIVDQHIGQPGRRGAGYRVLHNSSAGSLPHADHRVGTIWHWYVLQFPAKQISVEVLRLGNIGRVQFNVYKWICHRKAAFGFDFLMPLNWRPYL